MISRKVVGKNLPDAFYRSLLELELFGNYVPCPDYDTEIKEMPISICVENPLEEPMITKLGIFDTESLQQYLMEVKDGILDFMIGKGETAWEYTYHDRIKDQILFVVKELKRNKYSRRAVIDVRDNSVDMFNEHPACLQHIQFLLRDNGLNMIVTMRSNDAFNACFMNMFAFILGIQKEVADKLNVEVGEYIHNVGSFHIYKKDYDKLQKMLNRGLEANALSLNLAYNYKNNWDLLMKDEIPKIMKKVEDQKRKYGVK